MYLHNISEQIKCFIFFPRFVIFTVVFKAKQSYFPFVVEEWRVGGSDSSKKNIWEFITEAITEFPPPAFITESSHLISPFQENELSGMVEFIYFFLCHFSPKAQTKGLKVILFKGGGNCCHLSGIGAFQQQLGRERTPLPKVQKQDTLRDGWWPKMQH